ncbi:MAG: GtrA family protein [Chloroflexi bacterium]|nr:GtrA family protein [Chloroflexota bacterium]
MLELALLKLLFEELHWALPVATVVAAEVLILGKFLVNDRFVFGHAWPTLTRLLRYHGASAGALIVYWLVLNGLSLFAGVPYVAAFVVGTTAAFTWSLITNFVWVWEQHNSPKGPTGYAQPQPQPHRFPTRKLSGGE